MAALRGRVGGRAVLSGRSPSPRSQTSTVVLFDGVCGLCTGVVRFVIPRDPTGRIRFAPLQGDLARGVLARHGRSPTNLDTFVAVLGLGTPQERLLTRSRAALHLARQLVWPWRLAAGLALVPRSLLDTVYDLVARTRYRVFGRLDACLAPTPENRARFLVDREPA